LTVAESGVLWLAVEHEGASWRVRRAGGWVAMFLGTHTPRLDDKGRLTLPAKFRDALAGGLMVTKGQDHCLYVFPRAEFEEMARKVAQAPFTNEAVRAYQRYLFAGTDEQRPDGQGRISIAAELRRYAGLSKDCAVIGAINRLEIWDSAAWQRYLEEHEEFYAQAQEEVLPGVM
jgi:MraZ protein